MGGIIVGIAFASLIGVVVILIPRNALQITIPKKIELYVSEKIKLSGMKQDSHAYIVKTLKYIIITIVLCVLIRIDLVTMLLLVSMILILRCLRVTSLINKRKQILKNELPLAFEMLSLLLEAGIDFQSGLKRIANIKGVLAEEMKWCSGLINSGVSRTKSIQLLSDKWRDVDLLKAFSRTLTYKERFGGGLAVSMRALARQSREERWRNAEKAGIVSSQKMLVPLVIFIMPVTLVVAFAPVVLKLMRGELW